MSTFITDRLAQGKAGNTSNTGLPIYSYALAGKANHGPDLYAPNYKDFAPRVAFAYTPFALAKNGHQWQRRHCLRPYRDQRHQLP